MFYMPRGVKVEIPYDVKVKEIDEKIAAYQDKIDTLKKEKQNHAKEKDKSIVEAIAKVIKSSGKSPEEILKAITH
jgi:uncharacterized small protein (DUF1192 family)